MGSKIIGVMRESVLENALKSASKRMQKALPMSKLWPSLQSERYLQQAAYSRRQRLFPPREKLQQKLKLNNTAVRSRPISLTAEDFRQRNRDSQLYGKNQFCIRYRKTGTDHTLTVSPAMIRGEPIISISALKVPLCRQRFLRNCPMYFSRVDQTEKKTDLPVAGKKEAQMTSARGNKFACGAIFICFLSLVLLFTHFMAERKSRMKLYEKEYSQALISLETHNLEVMDEVR